jgi:hypothetical protein
MKSNLPLLGIAIGFVALASIASIPIEQADIVVTFGPYEMERELELRINKTESIWLSCEEDWLQVSPLAIDATAYVPFVINILVDRFGLAPESYVGEILIHTSGRDYVVEVQMSVAAFELPAVELGSLFPGEYVQYELEIARMHIEKRWGSSSGPDWIQDISPSTGIVEPGFGLAYIPLTLTISENLTEGLYEGELVFTSTAGIGIAPVRAEIIVPDPIAANVIVRDNFAHHANTLPIVGILTGAFQLQIPQFVTADIYVDFDIEHFEQVESAYLVISGNSQRPRNLEDIRHGSGYRIPYQEIGVLDTAETIMDIVIEIILALAKTPGTAISPSTEYPLTAGSLDALVLVDNEGREYSYPIGSTITTIYGHIFAGMQSAGLPALGLGGVYAIQSYSPVDILVTDSQGRRTGMTPDGPLAEIPNSYYSGPEKDHEYVIVFGISREVISVEITGTGTGEYGLSRAYLAEDQEVVEYEELENQPIDLGQVDRFQDEIETNNAILGNLSDAAPINIPFIILAVSMFVIGVVAIARYVTKRTALWGWLGLLSLGLVAVALSIHFLDQLNRQSNSGRITIDVIQNGHQWQYLWDSKCEILSVEYVGRTRDLEESTFPFDTPCGVILSAPDPSLLDTFVPISLGGESLHGDGETVWSDEQGLVVVTDPSGSSVPIAIINSSGDPLDGIGVASVANQEGMLLLIVPSASSPYVPAYHFLEASRSATSSSRLASIQSAITITVLEDDQANLIEQDEIPVSLLENLWNSEGWRKFVTTTHDFCESWSTLRQIEELVSLAETAGKAILRRIGPKALIRGALAFYAVGPEDIVIELCLAATGDGPGLAGLTTVVNDELSYSAGFLEDVPEIFAIGRTVDSVTERPISGVDVNTDTYETTSSSNGMFVVSGNAVYGIVLRHDEYEEQEVLVEAGNQTFVGLGEVALIRSSTTTTSGIQHFNESLKEAIEGADFEAMGSLMCRADDPFMDFWYGIYMYEGFPSSRQEALDNMADWDFTSVAVDISGRAETVYQNLVEPVPEFNGPIILAENWADGDENYLLEVVEKDGDYCWSGMLLYTNEQTPFGSVPPPISEWDFSDLDIFMRVMDWAVSNQRIDIIEDLASDPLLTYGCVQFCVGPYEEAVHSVFEGLFETIERLNDSSFYYSRLEPYEITDLYVPTGEFESGPFLGERGQSLLVYRKGGGTSIYLEDSYFVILGISFVNGRYRLTDLYMPSTQ